MGAPQISILHFRSTISSISLSQSQSTKPTHWSMQFNIQNPLHCNTQDCWFQFRTSWVGIDYCHMLSSLWIFSSLHPSLWVQASHFGKDDYNSVPLAPTVTKVWAHTAADKHTSFAPDCKVDWYIGPSPQRHHRYHVYFLDTMAQWCAQIWIFPREIPFPQYPPLTISNRQPPMWYTS